MLVMGWGKLVKCLHGDAAEEFLLLSFVYLVEGQRWMYLLEGKRWTEKMNSVKYRCLLRKLMV